MAKGIVIKVILKNGEIKNHTMPFWASVSEIGGWVDNEYGGSSVEDWKYKE